MHNFRLGPALANPKFRKELDELCISEQNRLNTVIEKINLYKDQVLNLEFLKSNEFFKRILNNLEFLLCYFDNFILFEDFDKLPGGIFLLDFIFNKILFR